MRDVQCPVRLVQQLSAPATPCSLVRRVHSLGGLRRPCPTTLSITAWQADLLPPGTVSMSCWSMHRLLPGCIRRLSMT